MVFKAAGGANMRSDNIFRTGENNYMALRRLLERNNIKLAAESVGGSIPRSMYLHLDTGRVVIKSLGVESEL
jgi:chemotaxis protein CheD